jgi:23S rRNA (adenine2503-C2)-methyltransferase
MDHPHGDDGGADAGEPRADVVGLPIDRLESLLAGVGGTPAQARRLMREVHRRRPHSLVEVDGVSRRVLAPLARVARVGRLARRALETSPGWEGTRKLLLATEDDLPVEAVLFRTRRDPSRLTLCLSSQVGCRMACSFCATGAMGFRRHLTSAEIVGQVWAAIDALGPGERLHNLVFMGMGEPLENYRPVRDAVRVLRDDGAFAISHRHVTVSTCGLLPAMERLARELPHVGLALSLHATRDRVRDELVPINRRWPIAALLGFLRRFPRKIFCIEYCLLAGVNDSPEEGAELGASLAGIRHKVHLIPYNPVPGLAHERPSPDAIARFAAAARRAGASVAVRDSRGQDILAACGQLGSARIGAPALPGASGGNGSVGPGARGPSEIGSEQHGEHGARARRQARAIPDQVAQPGRALHDDGTVLRDEEAQVVPGRPDGERGLSVVGHDRPDELLPDERDVAPGAAPSPGASPRPGSRAPGGEPRR